MHACISTRIAGGGGGGVLRTRVPHGRVQQVHGGSAQAQPVHPVRGLFEIRHHAGGAGPETGAGERGRDGTGRAGDRGSGRILRERRSTGRESNRESAARYLRGFVCRQATFSERRPIKPPAGFNVSTLLSLNANKFERHQIESRTFLVI